MPKYTLSESGGFTTIPEGSVLSAEVFDIQEKLMPFKDEATGNDVFKVEFKFLITEEGHAGRYIWGNTPTTFSENPDCKLRAWTTEILELDALPPGFNLDTDQMIGLPCRVQVGHRIQHKDGKDIVREYVSDVIRSRRREASASDVF